MICHKQCTTGVVGSLSFAVIMLITTLRAKRYKKNILFCPVLCRKGLIIRFLKPLLIYVRPNEKGDSYLQIFVPQTNGPCFNTGVLFGVGVQASACVLSPTGRSLGEATSAYTCAHQAQLR
jgi:hypothetical protein